MMNAIGRKNIWFSYNGKKNSDYGLEMLSMPTRPHPARKGDLVDVPGRDGKLFMDENAYDRVLVTIQVIAPGSKMDAIRAWLTGSGVLVFGDDPNRAYRASVTKEFGISNRNPRMDAQEFMITFDCEPYRYEYPAPEAISIAKSGDSVNNTGTAPARPEITVQGSGDVTIIVNGYQIDIDDLETGAVIDCELMECFNADKTQLINQKFTMDDFPVLKPGANIVTWSAADGASVTGVTISAPRWRYL